MSKLNFELIGDADRVPDEIVSRLRVGHTFKPVPGATDSQKPLPLWNGIKPLPKGGEEMKRTAMDLLNKHPAMAAFIWGAVSPECCEGPSIPGGFNTLSRLSLGEGGPKRSPMFKTPAV